MSKKHIIIIIIAALDLLVLAAGFILLRHDGQELDIIDGKITVVTQSPSPTSPQESKKPAEPSPSASQKPQKSDNGGEIVYEPEDTDDPEILAKQARIRELIRQVYALRDHYVSKLRSMESSAKAEYLALPDEEKTQENKESIAKQYISSAYSLESECDGKIDSICSEMGELLLETDGDFSIINKVRYTYASEKAAMKSEVKQTYSEFFD